MELAHSDNLCALTQVLSYRSRPRKSGPENQAQKIRRPQLSITSYFDAFDAKALREDFPLGEDLYTTYCGMSKDELFARQNAHFMQTVAFAWKVPFYQRLWGKAGVVVSDINSLADIKKLPTYSKADLMESVEAHPPIGDFDGLDSYPDDKRPPLIFQTTSGTTGRPQPLLFGPKSREAQNLLLGRIYAMQGMTNRDVIHSVYGHGMVNGGHYVREAVTHWVGSQMLTAGTGIETRSINQVHLMRDFGATAIVGFGDYINRLSEVAREAGLEPGKDIPVRLICGHMGVDSTDAMSRAWGGAEVFDWYGVGDTGAIAGQGPDRDGLHVMEDAQYIEILDVDDHMPVASGEIGNMVCTCLYKDDIFPIIRFNTNDVSRYLPGANQLGLPFQRIAGFLGRSDNMIKLRGINVYPQGIGTILSTRFDETNGEYYCRVERGKTRDEMTAVVEVRERPEGLAQAMAEMLRTQLGVSIAIELASPGETADVTGIEVKQKATRLIEVGA
ncbi:MAG: phenylacetate--CoA ligase family protein [Chromatiales bacterium]|nr:phenylacetate--CoA ligase family protein [Chromatiales bacterium]